MKINYNNTALGLLEHIDPFAFRMCEDADHLPQEEKSRLGLDIVNKWPLICGQFKKKIQYISQPFHDAYLANMHKLSSVIDMEEIDESGTFISRSSPSETNTIFYSLHTEGKGDTFKIKAIIFFFTKETKRDKPALAIYVQRNDKGIKTYMSETGADNGCTNMSVVADIFSLILFMKYCELQTKFINPKSKEFHINCKYLNETNQKIEILDSTWFTTIVRSDGFNVRGHFRLQPHGPSLSQRKLIWISEFDKTGYTRTAKIVTDGATL